MIKGLETFLTVEGLPETELQIKATLQRPELKHIVCCCLGPEGTNISQAAKKWIDEMGLTEKAEIRLFSTPEACLNAAKEIEAREEETLAIFWTCAVYAYESQFFFTNPDVSVFFTQKVMTLDQMQLATRPELVCKVKDGIVPIDWKISSHPSPQFLVSTKLVNQVILVNSNSAAAVDCKDGKVEACITTEQGRIINGLVTLHVFGSPPMIFFGGITKKGAKLVQITFKGVGKDI